MSSRPLPRAAVLASPHMTDIPLRAVFEFQTASIRHQAALVIIAMHAREDGTGAVVPADVLARESGLSPQWTRRAVRSLLENGYIRQPDPSLPAYDVALTDTVRTAWQRAAPRAEYPPRNRPNGPDGTWTGPHPDDDGWLKAPVPPRGSFIVYFLFDSGGRLCYIGRTGHLRSRLKAHAETKCFATWRAMVTPDYASMLDTELKLIRKHRPYLNIAGTE